MFLGAAIPRGWSLEFTLALTFAVAGLLTFGIRLSFIALLGRGRPPPLLTRALRFVPPAVLSAIILPALVLRDGAPDLHPTNARLVAGVIAALIAWRTRNVVLTIAVGMAALWRCRRSSRPEPAPERRPARAFARRRPG